MENTAAAMATLPDDVLREILVRVADAVVLFRCAMTCRRLCGLVADHLFLRRRWPDHMPNTSCLVGFFSQEQLSNVTAYVPMQQSPLSMGCRLLRSFFPGATDFLDNVEPLTSRGGLLLVRKLHDNGIRLIVCNPLTGKYDILQPLFRSEYRVAAYAILTSGDYPKNRVPSSDYSTFFKVLIIVNNGGKYILRTFSSDEPTWTPSRTCFDQQYTNNSYGQGSAIVYHGKAYWLFCCRSHVYTLSVSIETGHVSLSKLLIWSKPHLTSRARLNIAANGTLSLLRLLWESNQVDIWTTSQEKEIGDDTTEWVCTRTIQLERPKEVPAGGMIWPICVGERSGMLLFEDSRVHLANLKTGATEDVTRQFQDLTTDKCVPYEMDWPTLFISRLGGRARYAHA